jgi:UDP-glucose 4-epimerase
VNIAVIGGAGFVGSALSRALIERGEDVTVFDNASRGRIENVPVQATFVRTDASNVMDLRGFDWVYDFAARVYGVRDLYKDPADMLAYNMTVTNAVLKAAMEVPNYLYVSSSCVYDFPGAKVPHQEDDTNICDTSYGFSKVAGEQLVRWYAAQYGFSYKVARLFNVYGPGDSFKSPHVIPEFITKAEDAKTTGEFRILGDGSQTRDFTWMDDTVAGIMAIADVGANGEAYNVGTGRAVSIRALAEIICREVGVSPKFVSELAPREDIQRRSADNTKLRRLGWFPKMKLEDGIRRLIAVPLPA